MEKTLYKRVNSEYGVPVDLGPTTIRPRPFVELVHLALLSGLHGLGVCG